MKSLVSVSLSSLNGPYAEVNLGVGKKMDVSLENLKQTMEPKWAHFGRRKTLETSERAYEMMRGGAFQNN